MEIIGEVKKILRKLEIKDDSVSRIGVGFNNVVFDVGNEYILKLCVSNREENFLNELDFYKRKEFKFIPELIDYDISKETVPFYYMIQRKIQGENLFTVWSSLKDEDQIRILNELLTDIKQMHSVDTVQINYKELILSRYSDYLKIIEENSVLTSEKINYLKKLRDVIENVFSTYRTCLIHNDLQFNNIILMPNGSVRIIDFEHNTFAQPEKEFDSIFRMARYPHTFLQNGNDNPIDVQKFLKIKDFFERSYQEVSKKPGYEENMLIYDILNSIRWICKYPNFDRYNEILFQESKKLYR